MILQTKKGENDDAVSPVIGVMLLLVVTIVIAAVVAAFASGLYGDTDVASTVTLKLESYEMGMNYASTSYDSGLDLTDFDPMGSPDDPHTSYAPFEMTFIHMGGERLNANELVLVIDYNAASFHTPINQLADISTISAGDKLHLSALYAESPDIVKKCGLSQQNMYHNEDSPEIFSWSIIDGSGKAIASGTESTLAYLYV